ncbi:MAG: c-type cytochrome [Hydrogenophaga sp.]|uniref:c-type cytochrome n=1 Tax=Hydrogenophaga sp. TaxID=1904254 RepID=UPI0027522B95|nr:c-type cytochrome [Hydrogenophaga sp.]MDP2419162.1 c-type cytochrome [Hydrogenophaga sp.]MDZ4188891.1 c-type cytochrome [Hydrogenophaga sp.]
MYSDPYLHDPYLQERTAPNDSWLHRAATALALTAASVLIGLTAGTALAADHAATPAARAWTPASLRTALAALPPGEAERGRVVNQQLFCASCHGDTGVAPTQNWPHLAGQKAAYTAKMLLDYQSRLRAENHGAALMHDIAVMMTPQQIADVSAFYAVQPAPRDDGTPRPVAAQGVSAEQLVRKGDPARLLTPCASCHGVKGQGGKLEASALAGQNPLYFTRTLLNYQNGTRTNDAVRGMSAFAKKLSRSEIDALATYYADLPAGSSASKK